MIYGYLRVSTDAQTLENQRFEINKLISLDNKTILNKK
jgi:DNA invertase Pin-like site-specific DNA recombinase